MEDSMKENTDATNLSLPKIEYNRRRLEALVEAISTTKDAKVKILAYLDAIDNDIKEIEEYQSNESPEIFYEAMKEHLLSISNTSETIRKLLQKNEILSNKINSLIIQSIDPLNEELTRRLEMPASARQALDFKTRRLYAQQSFVARDTNSEMQKILMRHLGKIKDLLQEIGKPSPRCYISYAWPSEKNKMQEYWVQPFLYVLCEHLKTAGIDIVMDVRDNDKPGDNIYAFMNKYNDGNHIITIGTESLRQKHLSMTTAAVQTELNIALKRDNDDRKQGRGGHISRLLISGTMTSSFPDSYLAYKNIQDGRDGTKVSYLELIEKLVAWLHHNKLSNDNDKKEEYLDTWQRFYKLYELQNGLDNTADTAAVEQELQIGYHNQRLDYLRPGLKFRP